MRPQNWSHLKVASLAGGDGAATDLRPEGLTRRELPLHISAFRRPCPLRKRPATNIAQTCRTLSCPRLAYSLIDLEVSENLLASNPTRSNPCLSGKSRRKQPWDTPVKVK